MSVNRFRQHVYVLPEDDANRQLANGFLLGVSSGQIQILPEAGGWLNVCQVFKTEHIKGMLAYPLRHLVLLLDFDGDIQRSEKVHEIIPDDIRNRVFLLGVLSEPEALKRAGLGSYEDIGKNVADGCRDQALDIWDHDLLRHNAGEIGRLEQVVRTILFQS